MQITKDELTRAISEALTSDAPGSGSERAADALLAKFDIHEKGTAVDRVSVIEKLSVIAADLCFSPNEEDEGELVPSAEAQEHLRILGLLDAATGLQADKDPQIGAMVENIAAVVVDHFETNGNVFDEDIIYMELAPYDRWVVSTDAIIDAIVTGKPELDIPATA